MARRKRKARRILLGGAAFTVAAGVAPVIIDELVYEGTVIGPAEANGTNKDALGALNDGTLKIPALKRKDGSKVSGSRVVRSSVPMSASADGTRDNRRSQEKVAKRGASKSILTGQSLFGSRAFDGKAR